MLTQQAKSYDQRQSNTESTNDAKPRKLQDGVV